MELRLGQRATTADVATFYEVVLATGVKPRPLNLPGAERQEVVSYVQVLSGQVEVGERVAIVGAGGIGFYVSDFLTHDADADGFMASWGVDTSFTQRGGLTPATRKLSQRSLTMYQRSDKKMGGGLGKTTGWIHRLTLKQRGVRQVKGVEYLRIDDEGFHVRLPDGKVHTQAVDHVVVCAGQQSFVPQGLSHPNMQVIGGARDARGLDAKRAIMEGMIQAGTSA